MIEAKYKKYETYKDSGVKWLGLVPEHWEAKRLGTHFTERKTKVSDKDYAPLSVTKQGILPQLANAAKSNDGDNRKLVKEGDFVINSRSDRKGSSGIANEDGSVSLINIVMKPKNFKRAYTNYLLKGYSFIEEFYRNGRGIVADLWTTRYDEMKNIKIPIPPIEEQIAIANFLDNKTTKIDTAIAQKEKMIELLKERKQIIIQNAVTGKVNCLNQDSQDDGMNKIKNEEKENPQILKSSKSRFRQMKDSGVEWIGEIPEGWELPKMKFLTRFILDGTHGSFPRVEHGYRLLSVRNIIDSEFVFRDDDSHVSEKHFKEISSKFLIQEGDIQLAIVGATLGKVAIVGNLPDKFVTQRSLCSIRINKNKCLVTYLFYFIQSSAFQKYLWNNAGFSAQPGVYLNTIQNALIPYPSLKEQKEIVTHIETQSTKIDKAIALQQTQIEKLKEYKATLIDSAVRGKIKIV